MPRLHPIRALMYSPTADAVTGESFDISSKLSRPYDCLSSSEIAQLLSTDNHNIVAIDVPHWPIDKVGSSSDYAEAQKRLDAFVRSGVLTQHTQPAMYLVRQTYRDRVHQGLQRRLLLVANIELPEVVGLDDDRQLAASLADAGIHRHEETSGASCDDRLALLNAINVQTSPILGLYLDVNGAIADTLCTVSLNASPTVVGTAPDGTLHEVWTIDNDATIQTITTCMQTQDVIIADGHHRVMSQMRYASDSQTAASDAGDDVSRRMCMFALVSTTDPGMRVMATHRMVTFYKQWSFEDIRNALAPDFELNALDCDLIDIESAVCSQRFEGSHAMGLYDEANDQCWVATTACSDPLETILPSVHENMRRLDPVICHHLLLHKLSNEETSLPRHKVQPIESISEWIASQPPTPPRVPGLGIMLLPLNLDDIENVASAGYLLPADTTRFSPKVASGLLLNPLYI